MIKRLLPLIFTVACSSIKNPTVEKIPDIDPTDARFSQGVSAVYAGMSNDMLIVAGGANFPETPAAEGGVKAFYSNIYGWDGVQWKRIGNMEREAAYGSTVKVEDWLWFIGGGSPEGTFADVVAYKFDNGKLVAQKQKPLPIPIEQGGATVQDSIIYITGGVTTKGTTNKNIYTLNLRDTLGWQTLPTQLPEAMIQPVVVAQGNEIFAWGGFIPYSDSTQGKVFDYGYKLNPTTNQWQKISSYPQENGYGTMIGASGSTYGNNKILVAGGVNKNIFQKTLDRREQIRTNNSCELDKLKEQERQFMADAPEFHRFNKHLMIYDPATDTWSELLANEGFARAGAALVVDNQTIYLINGEVKPGIRSADVWKISQK